MGWKTGFEAMYTCNLVGEAYLESANPKANPCGGASPTPCPGPSPTPVPTPTPPPTPPLPTPPVPTPTPPSPSPSDCPGGSLDACIDLCPADIFAQCAESCAKRCPHAVV